MNEKRQTARAEVERGRRQKSRRRKRRRNLPPLGMANRKRPVGAVLQKRKKAETCWQGGGEAPQGPPTKADKAAPARPRRLSETNCPEVGKRLRRLKLPRNPKRPHPKMRLRPRNRLRLSQPLHPRPVEEGKLVYLKLSEMHPFHTFRPHPFKVRDDAKMQENGSVHQGKRRNGSWSCPPGKGWQRL